MQFTFTVPPDVAEYTSRWKSALQKTQDTLSSLERLDPSVIKESGHLSVLKPLDQLSYLFDANVNDAQLLRQVHPSKHIQDEAEKAEQEFKKLRDGLNLSQPIYSLLSAIDLGALEKAGDTERDTAYWVKKLLRDYKREGIDRDEKTREKVKDLKREITEIGQAFGRTIAGDTRSVHLSPSSLDGLPEDYVAKHETKDGKVTITTDYPDLVPFMQYAKDTEARKAVYMANTQRAYPKNAGVLLQLFGKRKELASLLGYGNYADYQLETEMVGSGTEAQGFIDRIDSLAKTRAERDYAELLDYKRSFNPSEPDDGKVNAYEARYLESGLKKTKYSFDSQAARQYFPFGKVRDGIMESMSELFGVRFKKIVCETWHPDVVTYELYTVEEGGDRLSGRFYLDLHPRENKYKHAAEFELRTGTPTQYPEAALICNFPAGEDSLMEHSEVTTFFHEFGHLLHHLFSSQRWTALGGIVCDFDFIEAPSQMLEEWAFDPATLKRFAKNEKGEVIPDEMIDALRRSRGQGRGLFVRNQMLYAALSLTYHTASDKLPDENSLDEINENLTKRYGPYEYINDTHFFCGFGHLDGYAAGYYSYMWSQVIAQDLFTRFQEKGLYDKTVARDYKSKVLGRGGSEDAREFVRHFLGRTYGFDAFGKYLEEGA